MIVPRDAVDDDLLPESFLRIGETRAPDRFVDQDNGSAPGVSSASTKSRPMIGFIASTFR